VILVYVAGPYTAESIWERAENIREAQLVGAHILAEDVYPIVPHEMGALVLDQQPPEYWYRATLALMLRCDAVVLTPRWRVSHGAVLERERALKIGMPVFDCVDRFEVWAAARRTHD